MRLGTSGIGDWPAFLFPLGSRHAPEVIRDIERRYMWYVPLAVILGLIASGLEGLGIGMLIPFLNMMLSDTSGDSYPRALRMIVDLATHLTPGQPLIGLAGAVITLVACKGVTQVMNAFLMAKVEGDAGRDIRDALAAKALALDYDFYLRNDSARLVTIIDTESWKMTEAIRVIFNIAVAGSAVAMFTVLLVLSNWRLFPLVLGGIVLTRIVQWAHSRRLRRLGRAVTATNRELGERMIQIVRAIRVIRLFGQERRERDAFVRGSEQVRSAMTRSERNAALAMPVIEIVLSSVILLVLITADAVQIGLSAIAAFLVLLYRMQGPLLTISHASSRLATLRGSIEEVEWLLGMPSSQSRPAPPQPPLCFDQPLRFERVSYRYGDPGDDRKAVHEIDFVFEPDSMMALVGRSGAGKSTIINLLCRLIEPTEGRILLGKTDIAEIDPETWRRHVALAGQDLDLVSGTVAANIAYGVPEASRSEIEAVARLADAHDFIMRLPQAYDTPLGSLGFGLSGGQRQRIGLARALLRKPQILILDEATSAVDGISEREIMVLLERHRDFGRALIVSHRPATLQACDKGIALAGGRVVEQGDLRDLSWYENA